MAATAARSTRRPSRSRLHAPLFQLPGSIWNPSVARDVVVGLLFLLGLLAAVSLIFPDGTVTAPIHFRMTEYLGWCAPLAPGWMLLIAALRLWYGVQSKAAFPRSRIVGGALASLACIGLAHMLPWGDAEPAVRAA